ncbi:unnamed protein product [Microthlaspi erraticum]|uniref:Uncharacterized protein n=1 Tax=Microthlaspi erraticum TaxID=1685480 RepID=A0A6D2I343_9BRAS|nr:unnamed protein product [Microthlaspi erraticum]
MGSMHVAFEQMKMIQDILENKDNVSTLLELSTAQHNLLTSPIFLPKLEDQGNVNLISLAMAQELGIQGSLQRPSSTIMFGDATSKSPLGVFKNYPLKVGECTIPTDLTVLDMVEEKDVPLILGTPFLSQEAGRVVKKRVVREARPDRLVQAPCDLNEESLQALFNEPLGSAQKEGKDAASKALLGDKRKNPQPQAPSSKRSQLTLTLFPFKFENGKTEYKIRYKGRTRPFSKSRDLITHEHSKDPTKLKELLSSVLTITLDGGTSSSHA